MNKADINRLRAAAPEGSAAQGAPERAQKREESRTVNLSPETINALLGGFSRELRRALLELGPILARIAAADTVHTVDHPPRVFGNALLEAQTAAGVLQEAGVVK